MKDFDKLRTKFKYKGSNLSMTFRSIDKLNFKEE